MATASNESGTTLRNGLQHSSLGKLPPELRLSIIQLFVAPIERAAVIPRVMAMKDLFAPLLSFNEAPLVITTNDPLASACHELRSEYVCALRTHVFNFAIPRLDLHLQVLDLDFSHIVQELLSRFDATRRQYRDITITIRLAITDDFALLPDVRGLQRWLEWKASEESAGKKLRVRYTVTSSMTIKGQNETESLRFFLLHFDPYSNTDGDLGGIMQAISRHAIMQLGFNYSVERESP